MSIPNVEVAADLFRKSKNNAENFSDEVGESKENKGDETNSTTNEELKEESKAEVAVVSSSGKVKSVEDKALQAVLAARRRSIEEGKTSGDAAKYQKRSRKGGRSEDESLTKSRSRTTIVALHLSRELQQKRRQMGNINEVGGIQEVYTDKDRAAAVTLGDQDIKTSLRVQQKSERKVVYPDEMDSNVYLTEAQKNLSIGNLETAYNCAKKAVDTGGQDPQSLLVRSRCSLSIGKLESALSDAQEAFEKDPNLIHALLVQAEALYAMGEFERALVLYHRGNRKRPFLASFRKGIQKSREAILNAIGGGKFPEVTGKSGFTPLCVNKSASASAGGSPEITAPSRHIKPEKVGRERVSSVGGTKKSKFGGVKPLVTEIKTSKMVSKKLLGGLSSDKEFLSNLLSRDDLATPKLRLPLEHSKSGRRKAAQNHKNNANQGNDIISDAKEALTSLQYLEAFMWQRDPSGLTMQTKENYLKSGRNPKRKKKKFPKRKIAQTNSCLTSEAVNEQETTQREIHIKENVASLLSRLHEHSDDSALKTAINEAENYVDELRKAVEENSDFQIHLCHLLLGLGKALPLVNRNDDGLALIKTAVELANER